MAGLGLVSPGIKVKEVDLTRGGITGVSDQTGAIAGPFVKGPVEDPQLIESEKDLVETFGEPQETSSQYEYWLSAASYLSYGGVLRVVRTDGDALNNANAAVASGAGSSLSSLKIKNVDDYFNSYESSTTWYYAAKNPGTWANGIKVCVIDGKADQVLTGIDTAGISSQALGTYTPTGAVYDGATGDLTLTMANHGRSAQNKIGINQNGLTFSCGMDNHGSNHAYPRVGDPAYKNAIRDITNITADTVTINVGTTPLVGHNVSDATYDPATGNLVLSLGAHNISTGNTLQLDKDALVFTCTQDSNATEHSYPRTSDPVYNTKVEVTAVEETDHTPTDAAYNPVNGELVLTVAGHGFKARSTHTPTDAAFNPATGILTLTVANHQFAAGTSVILANNSITFTCAKDSHATNHSYPRATDPAAGKRLPIQNITGNTFDVQIGISSDTSEHKFVSAGNGSVTRVGSMVKLVNDSLTFTCAKDNNASNHTYPRATDEASTEWLEVTTATNDTFLINVSPSPDTSIHNFVSAAAGAVKKQTGKITAAVGVTPEVTYTPTAATFTPTTGEMTLTIGSHTLSGPSTHTATGASYNPVTGILTTTVANHGFSLGDRVRIADNSLVMSCGMDGNAAQKSYPRPTDPYSKKWINVVGVTDTTFDVNVGTSPLVGFIPTAVDYNPTTGDMEMTIGSHSLTVGTSIKLAANSLTFTCAQDGGGSEPVSYTHLTLPTKA